MFLELQRIVVEMGSGNAPSAISLAKQPKGAARHIPSER